MSYSDGLGLGAGTGKGCQEGLTGRMGPGTAWLLIDVLCVFCTGGTLLRQTHWIGTSPICGSICSVLMFRWALETRSLTLPLVSIGGTAWRLAAWRAGIFLVLSYETLPSSPKSSLPCAAMKVNGAMRSLSFLLSHTWPQPGPPGQSREERINIYNECYQGVCLLAGKLNAIFLLFSLNLLEFEFWSPSAPTWRKSIHQVGASDSEPSKEAFFRPPPLSPGETKTKTQPLEGPNEIRSWGMWDNVKPRALSYLCYCWSVRTEARWSASRGRRRTSWSLGS